LAQTKPITVDNINNLTVDSQDQLYWNGRPIVTSWRLAGAQKWIALAVAVATILGGLGSAAQGWAAFNDWACKAKPNWPAMCTPIVKSP
jgi:hypothetical protein